MELSFGILYCPNLHGRLGGVGSSDFVDNGAGTIHKGGRECCH